MSCGDGTCNGSETCVTCPGDCGACVTTPSCGDGSCDPALGPDLRRGERLGDDLGRGRHQRGGELLHRRPGVLHGRGNYHGLSSGTVVLENNSSDDLALAADGSFTFATPLADCTSYFVTVAQLPVGQLLCSTVANAAGWISGANVTDVEVACSPYSFHSGYCVADPANDTLTGECMDLDACAIGFASYYCSGPLNSPIEQSYCGPVLDHTTCIY